MSYKTAQFENLFFIRWSAPPTQLAMEKVIPMVSQAAQQAKGKKLIWIASVSSDVKVPNAEGRKALNELMLETKKHCEVNYLIIEGNDLQHNLQRVIMQGVLILTRTFDDFLQVHKSQDAVLADVSKRIGRDATELFRKAQEAKVV
jgi:hypothetical protein